MLVDSCLKFYAEPTSPTWVALRSRSCFIDFNSCKAQVRRATLSYDISYLIVQSIFLRPCNKMLKRIKDVRSLIKLIAEDHCSF